MDRTPLALLIVLLIAPGVSSARKSTSTVAELTGPGRPAISELSSDVVFAASKRLQYTQEAPSIVRVFSREEIQRGGFRDLNELLATLPEIEIVDTTRNQYLILKGVPFTFLALLDGSTLINHGSNFVDLQRLVPIEIVQKVEVVLSPGGVLWGAHSLYGVINIVTIRSSDRDHHDVAFTAGWWNTFRTAYTLSSRHSDLRYQAHLSVETGRGETVFVEDSPYNEGVYGNRGDTENDVGLSAHAFGSLSWRGAFVRMLAHFVDDHPYPFSEITGARAKKNHNSHIEKPTYSLTAGYRRPLAFEKLTLELLAEGYLYHQEYHNLVYNFPPTELDPQGTYSVSHIDHQWRFGTTLEAQARYFQFNTILGWEGFRASIDDMNNTAHVNDQVVEGVILGAASSYAMSLYGQQEYAPHRDVNLAVGARWNISDSYNSAVLLHGHVVYEPIDGLFAKANYSEGFRPPSFKDRFLDAYFQKGSTDLDPERSRTVELQAEFLRSFWDVIQLRLGGGYTYSQLMGLIATLKDEVPPTYYQNLADEQMHTVSVFGKVQLQRMLGLRVGYAHHIPSKTEEGLVPKDFARSRLSVTASSTFYDPLTITVRYGYTGSREIWYYIDPQTYRATTLYLDGYHELAVAVRYRLFHTGLFVTGTLKNILFQDYDHTPPYNHIDDIYRGPFPQPDTIYGFLTLQWVYQL